MKELEEIKLVTYPSIRVKFTFKLDEGKDFTISKISKGKRLNDRLWIEKTCQGERISSYEA